MKSLLVSLALRAHTTFDLMATSDHSEYASPMKTQHHRRCPGFIKMHSITAGKRTHALLNRHCKKATFTPCICNEDVSFTLKTWETQACYSFMWQDDHRRAADRGSAFGYRAVVTKIATQWSAKHRREAQMIVEDKETSCTCVGKAFTDCFCKLVDKAKLQT